MDETGFCGEQKEAEYIGTGRNIFITVDGERNPVVITTNARDPKYTGGFELKLAHFRPAICFHLQHQHQVQHEFRNKWKEP